MSRLAGPRLPLRHRGPVARRVARRPEGARWLRASPRARSRPDRLPGPARRTAAPWSPSTPVVACCGCVRVTGRYAAGTSSASSSSAGSSGARLRSRWRSTVACSGWRRRAGWSVTTRTTCNDSGVTADHVAGTDLRPIGVCRDGADGIWVLVAQSSGCLTLVHLDCWGAVVGEPVRVPLAGDLTGTRGGCAGWRGRRRTVADVAPGRASCVLTRPPTSDRCPWQTVPTCVRSSSTARTGWSCCVPTTRERSAGDPHDRRRPGRAARRRAAARVRTRVGRGRRSAAGARRCAAASRSSTRHPRRPRGGSRPS